MKLTKKWGMIVLAVWLIWTGLVAIIPALGNLPSFVGIVAGLVAIIAALLILIDL